MRRIAIGEFNHRARDLADDLRLRGARWRAQRRHVEAERVNADAAKQIDSHPMDAAALVVQHERRVDEARAAWSGTADSATPPRTVWERLGPAASWALDHATFVAALDADVAEHGAPAEWDGFVQQYNRMIEGRFAHFKRTYSIGKLLGQGGQAKVMRAARARVGPATRDEAGEPAAEDSEPAEVALKMITKKSLNARAVLNLEAEVRAPMAPAPSVRLLRSARAC